MATYSKLALSGSTNGRQVKIASTTSTAGTTIHAAVGSTTGFDEVWIYATNNHSAAAVLTLQWGSTSTPDDDINMSIPSKTGLYLLVPGLVLQNSLTVKAYASVVNVISLSGWVNRITA